eukprot:1179944-Prorocentrum_minimum.AAC.1
MPLRRSRTRPPSGYEHRDAAPSPALGVQRGYRGGPNGVNRGSTGPPSGYEHRDAAPSPALG